MPRMNVDRHPQWVSTMSEDRKAEDRELSDLVLQAQHLRRQIDKISSRITNLSGLELVKDKKELVGLQRSLRRVLNKLNQMLLTIERYRILYKHLVGKYYQLQQYPTIWERLWNNAIDDRLFWLNRCSKKSDPTALPAYMLYDPNYEGEHGAASVWTWFSRDIQYRLVDQIRKVKKDFEQISIDDLTGGIPVVPEKDEPNEVKVLVKLLREDPDDIFTYKRCKSRTISYKAVALLMAKGLNPSQISSQLEVSAKVIREKIKAWNAYYRPYLNEALFGEFWLPKGMSTDIKEDKEGMYEAIVLSIKQVHVSLRQIVLWKLQSLLWLQVVQQLQTQPATKVVILFFLDQIEMLSKSPSQSKPGSATGSMQ